MSSAALQGASRAAGALARRGAALPLGVALGAALVALLLAIDAGVAGPAAVPPVVRTLAAFVALGVVCGYAPARLLLPESMLPHLALFVLPFGVGCSGLALTVLGFAGVPFDVSLPIVLGAGAAAAAAVRLRFGAPKPPAADVERAGGPAVRLLLPVWIAALSVAIALIPTFRSGIATVIGQNGDAVQAVGVTEILQDAAPPDEIHPEFAFDRVPQVWRSKYPIYYPASAVNSLTGLESYETFSIVCAGMYGLLALAFFAFAFYVLRAGPWASLAAMAVVPLSRWVLYLGIHPFYNQLWGLFLLAMIYVFGLRFLLDPDRRAALSTLLFAALGAFAYPLMLPFPAMVLALTAFLVARRRRAAGEPVRWLSALRLPRPRSTLVWIPVALVTLPIALVLLAGVVEKIEQFSEVVLPGTDLTDWRGADPYLAFPAFFGLAGLGVLSAIAAALLIAVGARRLWALPRELSLPLLAAAALGLLGAAYFRLRHGGELLYFRTLSFSSPFLLAAAAVALAEQERWSGTLRRVAPAALATLVACTLAGTRAEIDNTHAQLEPDLLELREFSERIPRDASVRIDLEPDAHQLWARHLLYEHPLSVSDALLDSVFAHPPLGRKADYVLDRAERRPADATGPAVAGNASYALYRMKDSVPGPDRSSRRLIDSYSGEGE